METIISEQKEIKTEETKQTEQKKQENKPQISEEELKAKSRKISIQEGSAYCASEGAGMRYITPYALALGANNAHIGILSSVPSLFGNFSKLYTIKLMEKVSRKKIAFYGALFQAIMWIFMILVGSLFFVFGLKTTITLSLLIIIYSFLIMFGALYGPAWSSWMKDLVSTKDSGRYFGTRNRVCGFVALIAMLVAGFVLDYFKGTKIFLGFIILFLFAFIFRTISASLFRKKYEPELKCEKGYYFSFKQFLKAMPKNNFGKFVIYVSLMNLATAIASPFFAVYMLKNLNFSYTIYIIIVLSAVLSKILVMPLWGKFADNYGNLKAVKITGFLVPLVPFLWLASILIHDPKFLIVYLMLIEAFSGFAWAGFELASSNFVYAAVTRQRMGLCVAYSDILYAIGVFIGAMIGGLISSSNLIVFGLIAILFVFLISGICRFLATFIMIWKLKEVKEVKKFGIKEAKEQLLALTQKHVFGNNS